MPCVPELSKTFNHKRFRILCFDYNVAGGLSLFVLPKCGSVSFFHVYSHLFLRFGTFSLILLKQFSDLGAGTLYLL